MVSCKTRAALLISGTRKRKIKKLYRHDIYLEPEVLDRAIRLGLFVKQPRSYDTKLSMSAWIEEQMIQAIREIEKKKLAEESGNTIK
jgi:hypothetical protein